MKFSNRQIPTSTHERLPARLEGFTIASGWNRPTIDRRFAGIDRFAQRGGLGKAHQLFGGQLPKLPVRHSLGGGGLDELNEVLAA